MAKKDMHTYVSRLKDTELETLIATYDIPLDLRPRLPDPNFRMINLPVGDTAIGLFLGLFDFFGLVPLGLSKVITFEVLCRSLSIEPTVTLFRVFQTLSKQGGWFSFAKRGGSAPVCIEVVKSGLKHWKEIFFLIDRRAIPFHMPWIHPYSCITDKVPTGFNQDHVDRLKAYVVKLRDIPEGVLVRSGLSRVWRNPMCDPVLRRSDNTVMSIHDFLCMPSLDKSTVREEPHELGTSILGRVIDRTTSLVPAGTDIPCTSLEKIAVTRPDRNVVTKADHAAKRKASTGPEISTNVTKRTRSSKKGSGEGSSEQAARDEFAMEGNESLYDVSPGAAWGVRRTTRASFRAPYGTSEDASSPAQEAVPAPDTQPLDIDAGDDDIARMLVMAMLIPILMLELVILLEMCLRGIFSLLSWDLITFLILLMRALGASLLLTPGTIGKKFMESILVYDRKNFTRILSMLNARYGHALKNVERLTKRCTQQTQIIKKQSADLKQQKESTVRANEEVSRKYRNERGALALKKEKIEEELLGTKSQLDHRE
ncbi:hypothetical protein Tco_1013885, partial [Tanacetum coccineum]